MPVSAPPRTRSGGKTSPGRAGSAAPVDGRAHLAQRLGHAGASAAASARRRPSSSVSNGRPASRPVSRRIVVPELPQSSAPAAARSPSKPDAARCAPRSPSSWTSTPSARSAARRRQVVAALPEAARLDDAVAERAEQQRAVRDRLVAGDPAGAAQRARAADAQQRAIGDRRRSLPRPARPITVARSLPRGWRRICRIASSLSARPSRRSAGMRRWPCTRVPSAVSDDAARRPARAPASGPSGSGRSCATASRCQIDAAAAACRRRRRTRHARPGSGRRRDRAARRRRAQPGRQLDDPAPRARACRR